MQYTPSEYIVHLRNQDQAYEIARYFSPAALQYAIDKQYERQYYGILNFTSHPTPHYGPRRNVQWDCQCPLGAAIQYDFKQNLDVQYAHGVQCEQPDAEQVANVLYNDWLKRDSNPGDLDLTFTHIKYAAEEFIRAWDCGRIKNLARAFGMLPSQQPDWQAQLPPDLSVHIATSIVYDDRGNVRELVYDVVDGLIYHVKPINAPYEECCTESVNHVAQKNWRHYYARQLSEHATLCKYPSPLHVAELPQQYSRLAQYITTVRKERN